MGYVISLVLGRWLSGIIVRVLRVVRVFMFGCPGGLRDWLARPLCCPRVPIFFTVWLYFMSLIVTFIEICTTCYYGYYGFIYRFSLRGLLFFFVVGSLVSYLFVCSSLFWVFLCVRVFFSRRVLSCRFC